MIIVKTLKDPKDPAGGAPMLQDTIQGVVYTPKRPHLTEMNPFVESFVNSQSVGIQGAPGVKRKKQLLVLVNSDEMDKLNDGVTDDDLADAWTKYTDGLRKEAGKDFGDDKKAANKAGNKAVDSLTDEQWADFCKKWVKENSGSKKRAEPKEDDDDNDAAKKAQQQQGGQRAGGRQG